MGQADPSTVDELVDALLAPMTCGKTPAWPRWAHHPHATAAAAVASADSSDTSDDEKDNDEEEEEEAQAITLATRIHVGVSALAAVGGSMRPLLLGAACQHPDGAGAGVRQRVGKAAAGGATVPRVWLAMELLCATEAKSSMFACVTSETDGVAAGDVCQWVRSATATEEAEEADAALIREVAAACFAAATREVYAAVLQVSVKYAPCNISISAEFRTARLQGDSGIQGEN